MEEIKILELFGGIGAIRKAFERQNIPHKIVDYVEIDKYAVSSYNAMFNENFEVQDITEWNKQIDIDFIMHGSPCQDFSVAGKQAGGDLGSGTRSSLMYETIRIVGKLRPKYVMWENVKNLLSKKHKHNFDAYIESMDILGYNSYYQVLNAKDYGIPQNRERVYTVSIRKDIDKGTFKFPEKEELKLRLKDMLEDKVDEKYYLSDEKVSKIQTSNFMQERKRIQEKEYSDTILARDWKDPKCVRVGGIFDTDESKHQAGSIYDTEGLSPTVKENHGTVTAIVEPQIITHNISQTVKVRKYPVNKEKLKQVLRDAKIESDMSNERLETILRVPITTIEHWFRKDNSFSIPDAEIWLELKRLLEINTDEFDESIMTFEEKDGVYDKANRVYDEQGLAPTLTQQEEKILVNNATKKGYEEAFDGDTINLSYPNSKTRRGRVGHQVSQTIQCNDLMGVVENLRIRKLTPKECWRLMGFDDTDFDKAEKVNSNTQLYKQAGNSIVVNVLEKILLNLFKE